MNQCPYCEKFIPHYKLPKKKIGRFEIQCEHCSKKFMLFAHIVFSFNKSCELNGEQHEWQENQGCNVWCKNCDEIKA